MSTSRAPTCFRLSRRAFAQLAACGLALPALEISTERSVQAQSRAARPKFLVYYSPNGKVPEWWLPQGQDGQLVFPSQSAALQPFAPRCLALSGLSNNAALSSPGAAHAMGTATVLTGTTIPTLTGLLNNVSVDQVIARTIGGSSRFESLQFSAGEPGPCDVGGSPCAYTQSASWAGPGLPLTPTINPSAAFEQLFAAASDGLTGSLAEKRKASLTSVLDHLNKGGTAWKSQLGRADQARLDEYFTSVEAVEKRIGGATGTCDPGAGPEEGLPYQERVEVFHDLMVLALSCGQTDVISFMIEFGLSGRSHPFLDATAGHHHTSHDMSPGGREALARIEGWHAQKLASLLGKLEATPGAEGRTLLDETLVLAMPSMGIGSVHDHGNVAPLLFGGDGRVRTDGRRQDHAGASLANLHVALLSAFDAAKAPAPSGVVFGDDGTEVPSGLL